MDGDVTLDQISLTTTIDNNGLSVGVFECDNQNSGNPYNTPNIRVYLPQLTFDEFTLEVIVKPTVNDETFYGYIIGIEDTFDNIQGNSISYNQIYNIASPQPNKFFPSNFMNNDNDGWMATSEYWDGTINTDPIDITKFYHVIASQDKNGLVSVFVNGAEYGSSYEAVVGGMELKTAHPAFHLKLCGDNNLHVGFDGFILAFGFYTEALASIDAFDACNALNGMVECINTTTATTTTNAPSSTTTIKTKAPSSIITTITNAPSFSTTRPLATMSTSIKRDEINSNWINKQGAYCGDGYTDLESSNYYFGEYCKKCPSGTAGTYGICEECNTFQEPNHSRTNCEYYQPWWLWLIQVIGGCTFIFGGIFAILKCLKVKIKS